MFDDPITVTNLSSEFDGDLGGGGTTLMSWPDFDNSPAGLAKTRADSIFAHDIIGGITSGLNGYFQYQTAKATSKNLAQAKPANTLFLVGGLVLVVFLIMSVAKK